MPAGEIFENSRFLAMLGMTRKKMSCTEQLKNKNTVLTLWSIGDGRIYGEFFSEIESGLEALTATKREFINKGGKYANHWVAFALYGV
jgi:hypothetical protein